MKRSNLDISVLPNESYIRSTLYFLHGHLRLTVKLVHRPQLANICNVNLQPSQLCRALWSVSQIQCVWQLTNTSGVDQAYCSWVDQLLRFVAGNLMYPRYVAAVAMLYMCNIDLSGCPSLLHMCIWDWLARDSAHPEHPYGYRDILWSMYYKLRRQTKRNKPIWLATLFFSSSEIPPPLMASLCLPHPVQGHTLKQQFSIPEISLPVAVRRLKVQIMLEIALK